MDLRLLVEEDTKFLEGVFCERAEAFRPMSKLLGVTSEECCSMIFKEIIKRELDSDTDAYEYIKEAENYRQSENKTHSGAAFLSLVAAAATFGQQALEALDYAEAFEGQKDYTVAWFYYSEMTSLCATIETAKHNIDIQSASDAELSAKNRMAALKKAESQRLFAKEAVRSIYSEYISRQGKISKHGFYLYCEERNTGFGRELLKSVFVELQKEQGPELK